MTNIKVIAIRLMVTPIMLVVCLWATAKEIGKLLIGKRDADMGF